MALKKLASISIAKINHDIEQLRYLAERGITPSEHPLLIKHLQILKTVIHQSKRTTATVNESIVKLLGSDYFIPKAHSKPGRQKNPALNANANQRCKRISFSDNKLAAVVVDDFLTPAALAALRSYCHDSQFWNETKALHTYLLTEKAYGFNCGLLEQIDDELKVALSRYLKNKKLADYWAVKYDHEESGLPAHADQVQGNLSCNIWITPNRSNLNKRSGGMTFYNLKVPKSWPWPVPLTDVVRVANYIKQKQPEKIYIPYRENRLVLFNSSRFHKTNPIHFGPGFSDRRISITYIYK